MANFGSLAAFAAHLTGLVVLIERGREEALSEAAKLVEAEAKSLPGAYQTGWPSLKPETIARKARGDTPLLETGEMRDSYSHRVISRTEAQVGSNDDKAVWHELGTSKVPPRPVLMTAAMHKEEEVRALLGRKAVAALIKP